MDTHLCCVGEEMAFGAKHLGYGDGGRKTRVKIEAKQLGGTHSWRNILLTLETAVTKILCKWCQLPLFHHPRRPA